MLITALKKFCTIVWKCDNGTFWSGYTLGLEKAMIQVFPPTDLKVTPHIESKIKMWKKSYDSLASTLGKSGFGQNHTDNRITVYSNDVWKNYVKDRATGKHVEGMNDAVNTIGKEKIGEEDNNIDGFEEINTVPDYKIMLFQPVQIPVSMSIMGKKKTEARLGMIAERIGYEHDIRESLNPMTWLSVEDKLIATIWITKTNKNLDLFFSIPDEDKLQTVDMILAGRI
ncbi:hypothetical protein ACH5RR_039201 [Cinchona calisaya]|uniref:Myb/SANT-like domain-containing protein n=1 Tax=Cinchona calisaya TaxID=153742 RepID=A0ABD2XYY8_9GENT